MPTPDWSDSTKLALAIADAAAEEILPHFRRDSAVDNKSDHAFDPVTEGDRAGERAMRALIEEHFPDHGILGEEFGEKESKSGFTWVLDPIDGTRAFICGMPTWATLVGLNYEGKPVVGVMNQPWVGEVFYGNPLGSWARRRGDFRPLKARAARPLDECILTTTAPELYQSESETAVLRELGSATRMTRYGGDAYFFCALALGQVDIAMDARMQPYDIAPLIPIISGAGGVLSTWNRDDASEGGDVISASSQTVLDAALKVIDRARSPKARAPRAPKLKVQHGPKPKNEPKEEAREEPAEDARVEAREEAKEAS